MANKETLSIAPYYGGKGRMAHFLVERLNYRDTNAFISPFGGMCRVLLNKLRHNTEIYNDLNPALCTLINVLSKPDMADEMIERLYTETEFSQDEFDEQKKIYDLVGKDLEQQAKAQVRSLLISKEWNVSLIIVNAVLEKFAYEAVLRSEILKSPSDFEFTYKHSTPVSDKIEELNSIIEEAMGIFIEQRKKWKPYEVEPGK